MKENKTEEYKLYDGEVTLAFNPASHIYTANGLKVPGVTGIVGVISKPALMYWSVNCAVEYLSNNWKPGVAYDELQIKEMLEVAKREHTKKKEASADAGTMVHAWISKWIKGEKPETPIAEVLQKSTQAFLNWVEAHNVEFLHSEIKVYSKKYKYAGTCDFIAKVDGKLTIGDIKTSNGIYNEMFFQTAAYQQAREEESPNEKYNENIIVQCKKDGELNVVATIDFKENIKAFLGALSLYNRIQNLKDKKYEEMV